MKSRNLRNKKSSAQAMVEFAIALPVLLMLLYGILETGRFLFLYSTVVTASRQAVRYGIATGTGTGSVPRYQDCDGIRQVANNAGYLGAFDTITLQNDDGPGTGATTYCAGSTDNSFTPSSNNSDRLVVTVTEQFTPLVPNFVPFVTRDITATSARTILVSIVIAVTAPPSGLGGSGTGELSLTVSASPTTYDTLGEVKTYTYLISNTSTTDDIDTPIVISGNIGSASCTGEPAVLTPGATFQCSGSYQITQADLDLGSVTNTATATADGLSDSDDETVTALQSPALSLTKVSDITASAIPNTVITYTYTLTNSGNVTLSPAYGISDNKINQNDITCPASGDVAPGSSVICTGTYTIKNPDINAGTIVNVATATAQFGAQTVTSNSATVTVYTPALYLTVSASPSTVNTVGQVITYTYNLKNNTNGNLRSPYTVTDSRSSNESCPAGPATLPAGGSVNCSGTYTVIQADLDAGVPLSSTISATARKGTGSGTETSNTVTYNVAVTQNPGLSLAVSANPTTATTLGDVVSYTYTLTNTGNVTLTTPSITDDKVSNATCTDSSPLVPGATRNCTGTRTISQADLDHGSVINQATASATLGATTVTSNLASVTVTTYVGARLTLVITSNPPTAVGAGQILTFTYTLKNTGNVPLTSPYSVTSDIAGSGDCSAASGTIPVGGSVACIDFYTTTPADVTNGSVTNLATATAMDGATTVTSNNASVTVNVTP